MKFRSFSYAIGVAFVVSGMVPVRVRAQGSGHPSAAETAIKAAEAKPTPRSRDGHPDLNGYWNYPESTPQSAHVDAKGNLYIDVPPSNGGKGGVIPEKLEAPRTIQNPPIYKPELLE